MAADTNVLISGVLWFGPAHRALALIMSQYKLVQSRQTLQEFANVIARPKFAVMLSSRNIVPATLVEVLIRDAVFYEISSRIRRSVEQIQISDLGDRPFLELALESGSRWVVSGDKHLLELGNIGNVRIIGVGEFITIHSNQG